MNFSNRLKRLRSEKGVSQADLAARLHYSRTTIANYEINLRTPPLDVLCQIADYFEVSLDYLVGRTNIREKNYRLLIQNQDSVILLIDPDSGNILDCSNRAELFYGYNKKELLQLKIWDLNILPAEKVLLKMQEVVRGDNKSFNFTHRLSDGSTKEVQVFSGPVNIDKKNILFSIIYPDFNELYNMDYINNVSDALANISCSRSPYKIKHNKVVAKISIQIARIMNLTSDTIRSIKIAASLHDIGLINIPVEIINKPSTLTEPEFSLIKSHPVSGAKIARQIGLTDSSIPKIIAQHHERIDGSGYPNNLTGNEIHIGAQIIAIADVVEAISSERPYRKALGLDAALQELEKYKGEKYDKQIVEILLNHLTDYLNGVFYKED